MTSIDLDTKLGILIGGLTAYALSVNPALRIEWSRLTAPDRVVWSAREYRGSGSSGRVVGMTRAVLLLDVEQLPIEVVVQREMQAFREEWLR